jgi:hypothetical protein
MPLYKGSGFWAGKQYQALTELHLPGPSVVIDVRQGSDLDPPLIWNLGIELDDLTAEMQLNEVAHWRYLNDCIDLLKLTPFRAERPVKNMTDFVLTLRDGQHKTLAGPEALVEELGRYHLDRVRNNRIGAVRDKVEAATNSQTATTHPEQATVHIFFIVDADDQESMFSATKCAEWLKKWNHEFDGDGRSGRDRRLTTLAICLNTDPHRHHPHILAKYLGQTDGTGSSLDAVILIHTYGDDEAYLGQDIQAYQVESILYMLLLLSLEGFSEADQEMIGNRHLSTFMYSDEYGSSASVPWPIYMMGISSLEYSARWGARWLDYGLVAKILRIMQETGEVYQEERLGRLRRAVQDKFSKWLQEVKKVVPELLTGAIPEFQIFDEFREYIGNSSFYGKRDISLQDYDTFCQGVLRLYTGDTNTLESALDASSFIFRQLKKDYMQLSQDDQETSSNEGYEKLLSLRSQAAQLPSALFHDARGMLPRVLKQMSELKKTMIELKDRVDNFPDMKEFREKFRQLAGQERRYLERVQRSRGWFSNQKYVQRRNEIMGRLTGLMKAHLEQVHEIISLQIALSLLHDAELYDPAGKNCPYHQRIKQFAEVANKAQMRASLQQERAYERLKLSLSQTQVGISQKLTWLSLTSRKDLLDWEQMVQSFEQLYAALESTPTALNLLAEWLLRLIGSEKPLTIIQQYLGKIKTQRQLLLLGTDEEARYQLQALSTILVNVLLLLDIVNFDTKSIQPLLNQYIDLKDRSSQEPSALESNILGLQNVVKEETLNQAMRSSLSGKNIANFALKYELPIERVLAAWVNSQYASAPLLTQVLERDGILARLFKNKMSPSQALDDLRERNRVLGYRESMTGDDRFYLLLPPGEAGSDFLKELDLMYSAQIQPVRFPDVEKLIYLHIHQLRQILPAYVTPDQAQISQNA